MRGMPDELPRSQGDNGSFEEAKRVCLARVCIHGSRLQVEHVRFSVGLFYVLELENEESMWSTEFVL